MKKNYTKLIIGIVVALILVAGGAFALMGTGNGSNSGSRSANSNQKVTLYKSPTCGCCGNYAAYLKQSGYEVDVVMTEDMDAVKAEHNIPSSMQSCHTMVVGDYFVEGHVPLAAVDQLLLEQPAVDGIALPGMPAGSPGMPGIKRGDFEIYSLTDGTPTKYTNL